MSDITEVSRQMILKASRVRTLGTTYNLPSQTLAFNVGTGKVVIAGSNGSTVASEIVNHEVTPRPTHTLNGVAYNG